MTKYDEICEVSRVAGQDWIETRKRCWDHMTKFVNGFLKYCGIPKDRVVYLRWNKLRGAQSLYTGLGQGEGYGFIPPAMEFDDDNGFWRLGFKIFFKHQELFIPFFVNDRNGKAVIKVGIAGNARLVDLTDTQQREAMYEHLIRRIKQYLRNPLKASAIGFTVSPADTQCEAQVA